eukprot:Platyproteum_vivax@DN7475_c1_g2_i2.p1
MKLYLTILVFGLLNCVHSLENRALRVRNRLESGANERDPDDEVLITYKNEAMDDYTHLHIVIGHVSEKFDSVLDLADKLTFAKDKLSADGYRFISAEPQGDTEKSVGMDMHFDTKAMTHPAYYYAKKGEEKGEEIENARRVTLEKLHQKLIAVFDDFEKGDEPQGPGKQ